MRVLTLPSALKHYSKYCICFQIWSSRLLELDVHLVLRTATKWLTRPTSWQYMHGIPAIAPLVATTECVCYDVDFPRCSLRGAQSKANIVARRSSRLTEMGIRCRRFLRVLFFWFGIAILVAVLSFGNPIRLRQLRRDGKMRGARCALSQARSCAFVLLTIYQYARKRQPW